MGTSRNVVEAVIAGARPPGASTGSSILRNANAKLKSNPVLEIVHVNCHSSASVGSFTAIRKACPPHDARGPHFVSRCLQRRYFSSAGSPTVPAFNCYTVLQVSPSASTAEIKRSYLELAKKHHPDCGGDAERFRKISEAYEVLTKSRAAHDRTHVQKPSSARSPGGSSSSSSASSSTSNGRGKGPGFATRPSSFYGYDYDYGDGGGAYSGGFSAYDHADFGDGFAHEFDDDHGNVWEHFRQYNVGGKNFGSSFRGSSSSKTSYRERAGPGEKSSAGGNNTSFGRRQKRGTASPTWGDFDIPDDEEWATYRNEHEEAFQAFVEEEKARRKARRQAKEERRRLRRERETAAEKAFYEKYYGKNWSRDENQHSAGTNKRSSPKSPSSAAAGRGETSEPGREDPQRNVRGRRSSSTTSTNSKSNSSRSGGSRSNEEDAQSTGTKNEEKRAPEKRATSAGPDSARLLRVVSVDFPRIAGVYVRLTQFSASSKNCVGSHDVFERLPCFRSALEAITVSPASGYSTLEPNLEFQPCFFCRAPSGESYFSETLLHHNFESDRDPVQLQSQEAADGRVSEETNGNGACEAYVRSLLFGTEIRNKNNVLVRRADIGKLVEIDKHGLATAVAAGVPRLIPVVIEIEDETAFSSQTSDPKTWPVSALDFFLRSRGVISETARLSTQEEYVGMVSTVLASTARTAAEKDDASAKASTVFHRCRSDEPDEGENEAADEAGDDADDYRSERFFDTSHWDADHSFCADESARGDGDSRNSREADEEGQCSQRASHPRSTKNNDSARRQKSGRSADKSKKSKGENPKSDKPKHRNQGSAAPLKSRNQVDARWQRFSGHRGFGGCGDDFYVVDPYTGDRRRKRRNPMVVVPRQKERKGSRRRGNWDYYF